MSDPVPNIADIIAELIKLGLWPRELSQPDPSIIGSLYKLDQDIFRRISELSLPEEGAEKILEKAKLDYTQLSINRKKEKKQKAKTKKMIKEKKWREINRKHFVHLGEGVSALLNHHIINEDLLKSNNLPIITNAIDLENMLGITKGKIKWLAYHRKVSKVYHYVDFYIEKSNGKFRHISSPKPELKKIQYILKKEIFDKIPLKKYIYGFRKNISTFDNAKTHCKSKVLINIDIHDFFPSISFFRVRKYLMSLGYSGEIATVISLLVTKQDADSGVINGKKYFIFNNSRYLPQGSPCSPVISNLVVNSMDEQLLKRAEKLGFVYTRYADDMSFSSKNTNNIRAMLYMIKRTLELYGFKANEHKTKVLFPHMSQNVTGLVINSGQPKINRKWRRNLRAKIYNYLKYGGDEYELLQIMGGLSYLKRTHPFDVQKYLRKLGYD